MAAEKTDSSFPVSGELHSGQRTSPSDELTSSSNRLPQLLHSYSNSGTVTSSYPAGTSPPQESLRPNRPGKDYTSPVTSNRNKYTASTAQNQALRPQSRTQPAARSSATWFLLLPDSYCFGHHFLKRSLDVGGQFCQPGIRYHLGDHRRPSQFDDSPVVFGIDGEAAGHEQGHLGVFL